MNTTQNKQNQPQTRCLQKMAPLRSQNSLPSLSGSHRVWGFLFMEEPMTELTKNEPLQEIISQNQRIKNRRDQEDARKFEQIIMETRQRLGLEVSYV